MFVTCSVKFRLRWIVVVLLAGLSRPHNRIKLNICCQVVPRTHYGVPWYFDWSCDWICVEFSFDFALDFSLAFSLEYSLEFKCSVVGCWIFIGCSLDIRWILENFPQSHHRVTLNICYTCNFRMSLSIFFSLHSFKKVSRHIQKRNTIA